MDKIASADGTAIAYERTGSGPPVVLVGGAFCDRNFAAGLVPLLADAFTVVTYDRRGRGDSGNTPPYAVAREIEDLQAVIDAVGGSAYAYGVSSGAILVFEAAAHGLPIRGMALVEPPYSVDGSQHTFTNLAEEYRELCAAGRPGDAVALFMTKAVGGTEEQVEQTRNSPMWPALEALAPTLEYDARIVGDGILPAERAAAVTTPALGIGSTASTPWLRSAAKAMAQALPNAEYRELAGEFHQPAPDLVAAELNRFYS